MPSRNPKWLTEGLKKVGLACLSLLLFSDLPECKGDRKRKVLPSRSKRPDWISHHKEGTSQSGKTGSNASPGKPSSDGQSPLPQGFKALLAPPWLIPGAGPFVGDRSGPGATSPRFKLSLVQCSGVLSRAADGQWQLTDVANNWKLERTRGGITDRIISGKDLVPPKLTEGSFPTGSFQSLIAAGESQTQTNDDAARLLNERMKLAVTEMTNAIKFAAPSDNKAFSRSNGVVTPSATSPPNISESLPTRHTFTVRDGQIYWVAEMPAG